MSATEDPRLLRQLQLAFGLQKQGKIEQAAQHYVEALKFNRRHFDALQLLGLCCYQMKQHELALKYLNEALAVRQDVASVFSHRGIVLRALGRLEPAIADFTRAIRLKPGFADGYFNRANALKDLGRKDEALQNYRKAAELQPGNAEFLNNLAAAYKDAGEYDLALGIYDDILKSNKSHYLALNNRGLVLHELRRYGEALSSFDRSLALKADFAEAHNNRGNTLGKLGHTSKALECYDRAIALKPGYADAFINRGARLRESGRSTDALASFDRAISLSPGNAFAHYNRGMLLAELKRTKEAIASLETALKLKPDLDGIAGDLRHNQMMICDWQGLESSLAEIKSAIEAGRRVISPWAVFGLFDAPDLQQKAARNYVMDEFPVSQPWAGHRQGPESSRIRIGYYSADFHNHATSYLMAELFERHDRSAFEFHGFTFGPRKTDGMTARVSSAFEYYHDVKDMAPGDIAAMSRDIGIDIAVDLKGYTQDSRPQIFQHRAAPIQANYIGHPGTMGADFIDYIIADRVLIPEASQLFYTEKVVYLPGSYQPNDSRRGVADHVFTRAEAGLPEDAFVFCCFNNTYKILPSIFECWMAILKRVPASVLWLLEANPEVAVNLRKEAAARGVEPGRLIFAGRQPFAIHQTRHRVADLFLDTFPCNAHTTASDALWAGLPIVTYSGNSFASRVCASLLTALDMPELITDDLQRYVDLAVTIAEKPKLLNALRQKLDRNRQTSSLFSGREIAIRLEQAFTAMYERHAKGLAPDHIYI